jgi:hypothetical protein
VRGEGEEEEEKKKKPGSGVREKLNVLYSFYFVYFLICQLMSGGQKTHPFYTIRIVAALVNILIRKYL